MNIKNSEKKYSFQLNESYQYNKYVLIIAFIFNFLALEAQTIDSAKTEIPKLVYDQFPPVRAFQVQYEGFSKRNFTSKLYQKPFQEGEIVNKKRLIIDANIPLYIKSRYIITAAVKYSSDDIAFNNVSVINDGAKYLQQSSRCNYQYFSIAESFTYFSSLFHKPVIYNANLIIDGNQNGFKRIYGSIAAMLVIKNSKYTNISVGLIGFIDPAAVVPAVPSFAMQLRFENSQWLVDCMLPRYIMFKRPLYSTARLSLGSELNSIIFYANPSAIVTSETYQFNQFELKTGVTFEQKITKHFILAIRAGYANVLLAQLTPINKSTSDYVYQTKPDGTVYYNIGLSYNIFKQKQNGTQKL